MNKLCKLFCLNLIIFVLILNTLPVFSVSDELTKSPAILIDQIRGQVLYEKDSVVLFSPSIMCKLMTALVAIEKSHLTDKVTISKNSATINGSSLNLVVGNLYSVSDLLYGTMLSQGNDAAIALAEYVGNGNINKFVGYMNDKAKELMLTDTYFTNPTGLYDKNQVTSIRDIANFVKYAISNPTFNSIFGSKGIPWISGNTSSILTNQNKLFWSYSGVDGGKIGTTPQQGSTLVTTATRDNRRLIAVLFSSAEETGLNDTIKLFDYGFSSFNTGILVSKNTIIKNITVANTNINLISKMDIFYTYPLGESYIKNITFTPNAKLMLPLSTDTIAGVLRYTLKDDTEIEVNLYSDKDITSPKDYHSKIKAIIEENQDLVTIVLVLLVIECILILYNLIKLIMKIFNKK